MSIDSISIAEKELTKASAALTNSGAISVKNGFALQTVQPWSPELVKFLSISLLAFTFLSLFLCAVLLWRAKAPSQQILKIFGVVLIIGVSALLLIVGFSDSQLTPIVGLFGAIAGYLLGKDMPPKDLKV